MKDYLSMSNDERKKLEILSKVKANVITIKEASEILKISYRQCRRVYKRYLQEGDSGLIHKSRGKKSNHAKPAKFKAQVLDIYTSKYHDFGPTLASEKLLEEGFTIDHNTLWQWLIEKGLWKKLSNSKNYRKRRKSRPHSGELIQMDGSDHEWFEQRAPRCTLMNMVDDATGRTLSMLCDGESTRNAMMILRKWIEKYGIPHSIYVDQHSVYSVNKGDTRDGLETQFARVCKELGIDIIYAYSPQAKGRVERNHAVYQDRFVKELRLKNISDIEQANILLNESFIDNMNNKFSVPPSNQVDLHIPVNEKMDFNKIFSICAHRVVNNDWTVRYKNTFYQILLQKDLPLSKSTAEIREYLDKTIHIFQNSQEVMHCELTINSTESKKEQTQPKKRSNKMDTYFKIQELRQNGHSIRSIQRELEVARSTIRKYLDIGVTTYNTENIVRKIDPYKDIIKQLAIVGFSAGKIHRALIEKGYKGCKGPIINYVKKLRTENQIPARRGHFY